MSRMSHKIVPNLLAIALLSSLVACQSGEDVSSSPASSLAKQGQYALREKMETLKATHRFEMKLEYALNDGTKNYRRRYTFTYTDKAYALTHGDETYGYASHAGGIYTFSILNGTFDAGPVYNLNIDDIWDSRSGLRNYYDGLNPSVVGSDDTYVFALSDTYNLNACLQMSLLTPSTGLASILHEFSVTANQDGLIFYLDFGANGYIQETVTHIGEQGYVISALDQYESKGGLPRQADEELVALMAHLDGYNYESPMGSIAVSEDKTITVGTRYFTNSYVYEDYTDEYIAYAAEQGVVIKRGGYVSLSGGSAIKSGIYQFTVSEDSDGNPQILSKDLSLATGETSDMTKAYPYFNRFSYMSYLSSFYPTSSNPYTRGAGYVSTRTDLASEFQKQIFQNSKTTPTSFYLLPEGEGENLSIRFLLPQSDNTAYSLVVTKFGTVKIPFIESFQASIAQTK